MLFELQPALLLHLQKEKDLISKAIKSNQKQSIILWGSQQFSDFSTTVRPYINPTSVTHITKIHYNKINNSTYNHF